MIRTTLLIVILSGSASAEVVQGTVLEDHSGTPILAASVKLKTIAGITVKEMDTDRTGSFRMPDVPAGEYQVTVTKSNYASVEARITAQPEAAAPPVFRLIKYGVVSGRITSPRMGGTVVAIEQVADGQIPRSYTGMIGATGEFRIFGIPPGRYQLAAPLFAATNPGPLRGIALYPNGASPREFVITGGEQYEVQDFFVAAGGSSSISGKVIGPGAPQPYSLTLVESDHPSIRLMVALTAMDGTFHFDSVFPGTYDLYATGPVMPPPSFFAHVHLVLNSQKLENMELVLKPGRAVEFTTVTNNISVNSPCSPEGVITLQAVGNWVMVRDLKLTAPIAPLAPARIENIAPGPFNVSARSTTGNCTGVTIVGMDLRKDTAPEHATVVFQPPSSIHGTAPGGSVVVLRDLTPGRDSPVQALFANTAGGFRFDGLAPGQYCVAIQTAIDVIPRWSPESGCSNSIINLSPGESKGL